MAGVPGSARKAQIRRLLASRVPEPASPEPSWHTRVPPWVRELSPPPALARWASSFGDLRSCWNACPDPEWLLWLAARTCDSEGQRRQVVLCAAELAGLAQRRGRDIDPRVTRAILLPQMWAGLEADVPDLLAAERDALQAARETAQAAVREAERARALFQLTPRRRLGSFGMSRALGAWQWWLEQERGSWLALAAASVARAAALADDPAVTAIEWAGCVSQSAAFGLRAMPGTQGGRPARAVTRHCLRHARRRLTCP
jgi:hypothetical protein